MVLMVLALALVAFRADAWADHLALRNGDTLTGTVTGMSDTEVAIQTELAGHVTIKRADIVSMTASRFALNEPPPAPATAHAWHGAVNSGWDVSRGNSETATISTYGTATRLGPSDRLGLFGTFLLSNVGSGGDAVTTANAVRGGTRYDHDLARALFAFGFGEAEHDPPQLLDHRAVVGGGLGAHLRKTPWSQFNVFGGVSYAHDQYAEVAPASPTSPSPSTGARATPPGQGGTPPGLESRGGTPPAVVRTESTRSLAELVVGEDWTQQLSDSISASQSLRFFPALHDTQDYRVSFDLSLSAQLNGWLHWNVSLSDLYLNIPPAGGAVQNDLFLSTGLGLTFGNGGGGAYTGADAPPRRR